MLDWIRKQIKTYPEKRRNKKQAKKEAKKQKQAEKLRLQRGTNGGPDADSQIRKIHCFETENVVLLTRSSSVRQTKGGTEQNMIFDRMSCGLFNFERNDIFVSNNEDLGCLIFYDTFMGLEVKTDKELYKAWKDTAFLRMKTKIQCGFSTSNLHE